MALQPGDPFYDEWWAAMQGAAMPQPLAIEAPELAPPIIGSLPQLPPPPPPPPPPPQQIGPAPIAPTGEMPQPELAPPDALPTPELLAPIRDELPTPPLAPVGSGLDAYGMQLDSAQVTPVEGEIDAVSGVGAEAPPPGTVAAPGAVDVAGRTTTGEGELPLTAEELLQLDPLSRAAYDAKQDEELAAFARKKQAEIQLRDAQAAEEDLRVYQDSQRRAREMTESAINDANALAAEKPKKFDDSIGNVVSALAGIMLGSLGGAGDKTVAIVQKRMDDFATEQINEHNRKAGNIDRQMNIAGRLRDAGYNEFQTRTVIRMAGLQRMREQLLTEMQNYDPRGTTARNIANAVGQAQAQYVANARALNKSNLDDEYKRAQIAKERVSAVKTGIEAQRELAKLQGIGTGGGKKPPEYFEALGLRRPPVPMTEKAHSAWVKNKIASENLTKVEQEATAGRSQGMSKEETERGIAGLKQSDGTPFVAQGTPEAVNELRKRAAATKTVVRILDQIDRTRTGWSPDIIKSDEWKQLKADWAAAKGVAKDVLGLGALSGPDEALIENYLSGGLDPTGLRDPGPGLGRARQNMLNMTRDSLETAGFTGKYDIPKPKLESPVATPSDVAFNLAQKKPSDTDLIERSPGFKVGKGETVLEYAGKNFVLPGQAVTYENIVLPEVRREIGALATNARSAETQADRDEALAKLQKLVDVGGNAGTKAAAKAALESVGRPSEEYEDVTGQHRQGARETVPPIRSKK